MFRVAYSSWVRLASLLLAQQLNCFNCLNKESEQALNLGGSRVAKEGLAKPILIRPSVRAPFFKAIVSSKLVRIS